MNTCAYIERINVIKDIIFLSKNRATLTTSLDEILTKCQEIVEYELNLACFVEYETVMDDIILFLKKNLLFDFDKYIRSLEAAMRFLFIERKKRYDQWHSVKRCYSFDYFDSFLSSCAMGVCPEIRERHVYYLVDISINGYINQRSYYYHVDDIGIDDNDRYLLSLNKVKNIFNCKKQANMDEILFDTNQLQIQTIFEESAKRRKAYWTYLSNTENIEKIENFYKACAFLDTQISCINENNEKKYEKLLLENLDKANALDLFRLCNIRNRCCRGHICRGDKILLKDDCELNHVAGT